MRRQKFLAYVTLTQVLSEKGLDRLYTVSLGSVEDHRQPLVRS